MVIDHQNQNPKQYLCLDLHWVLFFSFFFSKLRNWSSCGHQQHHLIITCSITWHVPTSLSLHTFSIEVSTRVSSIIQNQTRAFSGSPPSTSALLQPCSLGGLVPRLCFPSFFGFLHGDTDTKRSHPWLAVRCVAPVEAPWLQSGTGAGER